MEVIKNEKGKVVGVVLVDGNKDDLNGCIKIKEIQVYPETICGDGHISSDGLPTLNEYLNQGYKIFSITRENLNPSESSRYLLYK